MKKLDGNKIFMIMGFLYGAFFPVLAGCGATEVNSVLIPSTLINASRDRIEREWGAPYKIYRESSQLKYGADELWVYRYPDTSSEGVLYNLYFKDGSLIRWDNVVVGDL